MSTASCCFASQKKPNLETNLTTHGHICNILYIMPSGKLIYYIYYKYYIYYINTHTTSEICCKILRAGASSIKNASSSIKNASNRM